MPNKRYPFNTHVLFDLGTPIRIEGQWVFKNVRGFINQAKYSESMADWMYIVKLEDYPGVVRRIFHDWIIEELS